MKEIRFHGRGGQGVVKAAQILVEAVVAQNKYAHFVPFFGVERKGSPVYGFARIDDKPIRLKTQVYDPNSVIILDDTLLNTVPVFSGLKEDGIVVLNSKLIKDHITIPDTVKTLGVVDATEIALTTIDRDIPNTAMLGAFAKVTGYVDFDILLDKISNKFGQKNADAALKAYNFAKVYDCQGGALNVK